MKTLVSCTKSYKGFLKRWSDDTITLSPPRLTLYRETNDITPFKSERGIPLAPIEFQNFSDFYNSFKSGIPSFGQHNPILQHLQSIEHAQRFEDLKITSIDIEVDSPMGFPYPELAEHPITCIACVTVESKTVFSLDEWSQERSIHSNVRYIHCSSETELLERFLNYWKSNCPHILTGWNSDAFDIPYLFNRILQLLPGRQTELSPFYNVREGKFKNKFGKDQPVMYLEGLESLDLMRLYQKFVFESVPTHRLDYIASRELAEGKLEFTGTHSQFRASDPQKYVDYCIKDAELVLKINDKRKLLQLACTVAWLAKTNISDVYSPVKTWDAILCNDMKADGVYPTIVADIPEAKTFLGAFVKEPKPDLYDWVLSFDVTSLYPSLIMQFNMCASSMVLPSESIHLHEKMLDGYKLELEENLFTAANSVRFDGTKKAYMAEAAKRLFADRVKAKAKMLELQKLGDNVGASQYKTLQEAIKVTLNSLYGACGNRWFRFYDIRIAEAITASGQYAIRKIEQNLNGYMGYDCVIAMDTDSVYVNCGKDHTLDSIKVLEVELDKKIKEWCDSITQSFGCTESYIHLKRESIAKRGLWTGKKRYALDLLDVEGVPKNEIKTVGLETAKGSSAIITKKIMNEALNLVMRGTDRNRIADKLDMWYNDFIKCDLVAMAEVMKVGDMTKVKGMHINARAAKALNDYYGRQVIQEDEKALIFYLNEPNIYDTNVVAVPLDADGHILKEVNRYVDYKKMYDKLVEKVVGRLADAANIPMVRELENLF